MQQTGVVLSLFTLGIFAMFCPRAQNIQPTYSTRYPTIKPLGGVAGTDVPTIFKTGCTVDIRGIQCTNIDIGTVGGVMQTQKGPIIGIITNMPYSIESPPYTPHVSLNGIRKRSMISLSIFQEFFNIYRLWMDSIKHQRWPCTSVYKL
jgi:hypothetical protein